MTKNQIRQPSTKFCPLCGSKIGYVTLLFPNDTYITQMPVCKKCRRGFFVTCSEPITKGDIVYDRERRAT